MVAGTVSKFSTLIHSRFPILSYLAVKLEATILNAERETDDAKIPRHSQTKLILESLQNLVG